MTAAHNDNNIDHRITRLEVIIENINQTLIDLKTDNKEVRNNLVDIRKEIDSDFKWTIRMMIGFTVVICGIMAHGFHWF